MGDFFLRNQNGGSGAEDISTAVVTLESSSFVYDGTQKVQGVDSVALDGVNLVEGTDYTVIGNVATDAGTHTLTVIGINDYSGAIAVNWSIAKASLPKPTASGTALTYDGTPQSPTLTGFDGNTMSQSGDLEKTNAGSYSMTVSLNDTTNAEWSDGSTSAIQVPWSIAKRSFEKPTITSGAFTYNGSAKTPDVSSAFDSANMTKGGDTSKTNAGNYTLTISLNDTDNNQWSDGSTAALSLSWTINKASGSISVSPATLNISGTAGATGTAAITKTGDGAVTVESSATGVATASISGNNVVVSAVNDGTATITVRMAAGDNYKAASCTLTANVTLAHVYGASWDGTSTTAWTRTDDSANFADPVPYIKNATAYSSPFDNLMPWSGMTKVEDSEAGTMVAIPKFWYKLTQSGSGMKIQISNAAIDGYDVSPAHMDRGDGKGERDVVYIARYHAGASACKSVTGQKPKVNITRSTARTQLHALGSTIWQADWAMRFTIWLLYIVEFANWNSQDKIGYGCGNNSAVQNMGASDSMPYHTGTMQTSRTTYGVGVQYRWIEGLWDNCYDWLDGCYNSSSGLNLILDPSKFSDSANGISVGTPVDGYPKAFSVKDVSGTFPLFISSASGGSSSTYSCDYWYFSSSSPCVYAGGGYYQYLSHGLFCFDYGSTSNSYDSIGSRSMKLP